MHDISYFVLFYLIMYGSFVEFVVFFVFVVFVVSVVSVVFVVFVLLGYIYIYTRKFYRIQTTHQSTLLLLLYFTGSYFTE